MSTDIKVNDLVYVAKPAPCCGSLEKLGAVFTVTKIETVERAKCTSCGEIRPIYAAKFEGTLLIWWVECLKKFDPKSAPGEFDSAALRALDKLADRLNEMVH